MTSITILHILITIGMCSIVALALAMIIGELMNLNSILKLNQELIIKILLITLSISSSLIIIPLIIIWKLSLQS